MCDPCLQPGDRCPKCGAKTRLVHNSFYGRGLSVSDSVRLCLRCDWVTLVRTVPDEFDFDGECPASTWSVFVERLNGVLHTKLTGRDHHPGAVD